MPRDVLGRVFGGRLATAKWPLPIIAGLIVFCLCMAPKLRAQAVSSSIVGTVVDSTGAAVPDATVTLTNLGTNAVRTATTGVTGIFRFPNLLPGNYNVSVDASGFKRFSTTNIQLTASETRDLGKLTLAVGTVTQTVTVTAAATPIQTSSSELGSTVTGSALNALPLKGRDMLGAVDLIPGVVDTDLNRSVANPGSLGGINLNGGASNGQAEASAVNFTVDGITDMDTGSNGTFHYEPNMGAIREVSVLTNNYSAEYGRTSGGTIQVVTKSGTSQYHGQGWWDHRHEQFNANDYFNKKAGRPRALYRYNIDGWAFGGPVPIPKYNSGHNKLFFFGSQEYTGQLAINSTHYVNVPNSDLRGTSAADQACNCINLNTTFLSNGHALSDIQTSGPNAGKPYVIDPQTGNAFPTNPATGTEAIPMGSVDPVGLAILKYLPTPQFDSSACTIGAYQCNYQSDLSNQHPHRNDVIRVDWNPSSKLTSYFRYINDHDDTNPFWYFFSNWDAFPVDHPNPGHGYAGSFTYILSPTLINEVTVGYDWNTWSWYLSNQTLAAMNPSNVGNPPLLLPRPTSPAGVNGYSDIMPGFGFGSSSTSSSGGDLPNMAYYNGTSIQLNYYNENPIWTVADNLTKVKGTHQFKMGVYIEHNAKIQPPGSAGGGNGYAGDYIFGVDPNNPLNSGDGYTNALLGNYDSFTQTSKRVVMHLVYWNIEPYVQDSWRATSRLTLDLGVRFYVHPPQVDANGTFSYFDANQYTPAAVPRIFVPACTVALLPAKNCAQSGGQVRSSDPTLLNSDYTSSDPQPLAYIGAFVPGSGNPANGMVLAKPLESPYKWDFPFAAAPRVGFAVDVFGSGKTAMRGGFGMFYTRLSNGSIVAFSGQLPFAYTYSASNGTISGLAKTTGVVTPAGIFSMPSLVPWVRTYNGSLNIQQSVGFNTALSVAYAFNLGRDLPLSSNNGLAMNINPVPLGANFQASNISPVTGKALTQDGSSLERAVYPGFQDINIEAFTGYSNYHSLQVSLQHRLTGGLLFGVAYTYSKALAMLGFDPFVSDSNARNYGPSSTDRRQNLQINYSYALPGLSKSATSSPLGKFAGAILNNWTFAGLTSFQTGAPLMVTLAAPGVDLTGSASETPRPDLVCNPSSNVPAGFMFNPSCFAMPSPYTSAGLASIGNEGVNPVFSKGLNNWNMTLTKFIPIGLGESRGFELQFQGYNVFNHTQFDPGTGGSSTTARFDASGNLTDASALGAPASDATGPRVIAFELNFKF